MHRIFAAACAFTLLLALALPALAHENEEHEHGDAHHHDADHTHLPVDYSFREDRTAYPAPEPAGDDQFWWRGNLHTHTLWSDGDQFPEVVTQWYVEHGYHFLALSDHNTLQEGERWINPMENVHARRGGGTAVVDRYRERFDENWIETREEDGDTLVRLKPLNEFRHLFERAGRFMLVQSEEITGPRVHVNATNIHEKIDPSRGETEEQNIRHAVDAVLEQRERTGQAMIPHLNHPNFRWAVTAEDMAPVENLQFFEVYNGHPAVFNFGGGDHADLDTVWDIVLTTRLAELDLGIVYGLAVDDAHQYLDYWEEGDTVASPGRGWIMVRARYLTPENIIHALERGDFYASSGVTLRQVEATSDALAVEIEPEDGVSYTIQFIGTREGYDADREPYLDEDGNERDDLTMKYSDDVGEVLEEVEGTSARYEFEGDEIYVRARIISTKAHPNPFTEGEHEQAWVQPVIPGE